jgi:crotonobetaine/carnitine-CoA ligase
MSQKKFRISRKTTFWELIQNKAETLGDKNWLTFIVDFDKGVDKKYSFKDVNVLSNRLANGLMNLGINPGDGVALMETNSPEFLFTVFATFKMAAYTVLVNIALRGDGLKYIIEHSDAKAIIINWSLIDAFFDIKDQVPHVKYIIIDGNEAPADFKLPEGAISLQEIMEAPDDDIDVEINLDDLCMLMYTAGTTGLPKAIMFWQGKFLGNLNIQTLQKLAKLLVQPGDVIYTGLPLFHSNALFLSTLASYLTDMPLVLGKRFTASRHWDICRKYDITVFNTLGAMVTFLMKQPERPNDKEHKVRVVNTAACPKEIWKAFEERFGVRIAEAYGATDGGGFMLGNFMQEEAPVGTMGKPLAGTIVEIMDENGNILGPDTVGELVFLVRESELASRKVKYYKDEKSSKNLIQTGADGQMWFHTGDLATKDKDGWVFFVDRIKDSIRRRGENIASVSIENIILQHQKVLESAAYGVNSELGEDDIMVALVLKTGESMTPEELIDFCKGKMADFMIPRYIEFMDELPKSEVHRVLKRELKSRGVTESTFDIEKA